MTLKCHPLELSEHTSKFLPIRNTHFRRENPVVLCRFCSLFRRQDFLIQSLTRTSPGENNFDILVRLEPVEPDERSSEINDLDRLTHVEDENLATFAKSCRLQDELHRLGDGHEVARHLWIGDGDRPPSSDLFFEKGNYTPAASQD